MLTILQSQCHLQRDYGPDEEDKTTKSQHPVGYNKSNRSDLDPEESIIHRTSVFHAIRANSQLGIPSSVNLFTSQCPATHFSRSPWPLSASRAGSREATTARRSSGISWSVAASRPTRCPRVASTSTGTTMAHTSRGRCGQRAVCSWATSISAISTLPSSRLEAQRPSPWTRTNGRCWKSSSRVSRTLELPLRSSTAPRWPATSALMHRACFPSSLAAFPRR